MWEALDVLGARRIGHGVRCTGDEALRSRLRRDAITLEMCPTSNVQTGAGASISAHPVTELLASGLAVTISTDTRTTSATTLQREICLLREAAAWTAEQEARTQQYAPAGAFRPHPPGPAPHPPASPLRT